MMINSRKVFVDTSAWIALINSNDDLAACISFVVMRQEGISEAFTSDRHFEQPGFTKLIFSDLKKNRKRAIAPLEKLVELHPERLERMERLSNHGRKNQSFDRIVGWALVKRNPTSRVFD